MENYARPMWPGWRFGAPFFIDYGKNGGSIGREGAAEFVYATSTNGFWNDGDSYILGRVPRNRLTNLRASDWSYAMGTDADAAPRWSPKLEDAVPVFSVPANCGQGPVCYIPALGSYLLVAWYNTATMKKWFELNEIRYDFYQMAHPWEPWRLIDSHSDNFLAAGHMYGPSLYAKFQRLEGSKVRMSLFTSGCPFSDVPSGLYEIWEIPLILRTAALPIATIKPAMDKRILYRGNWRTVDRSARILPNARKSATPGDSAELTFQVTGFRCIAEKDPNLGSFDIYVHGRKMQVVTLRTEDLPRMFSVEVFAARGLSRGMHRFKLVNTNNASAVLDGLHIEEGEAARAWACSATSPHHI